MQTNLLENIITTHSDVEDYCRFIREKFKLSLLILNSNNREKYYSVSDLHLKFTALPKMFQAFQMVFLSVELLEINKQLYLVKLLFLLVKLNVPMELELLF